MKLKMENRLHIYDTNRPRPRHGCKYTQYKATLEAQFMKLLNNVRLS